MLIQNEGVIVKIQRILFHNTRLLRDVKNKYCRVYSLQEDDQEDQLVYIPNIQDHQQQQQPEAAAAIDMDLQDILDSLFQTLTPMSSSSSLTTNNTTTTATMSSMVMSSPVVVQTITSFDPQPPCNRTTPEDHHHHQTMVVTHPASNYKYVKDITRIDKGLSSSSSNDESDGDDTEYDDDNDDDDDDDRNTRGRYCLSDDDDQYYVIVFIEYCEQLVKKDIDKIVKDPLKYAKDHVREHYRNRYTKQLLPIKSLLTCDLTRPQAQITYPGTISSSCIDTKSKTSWNYTALATETVSE